MAAILDLQIACDATDIPAHEDIQQWLNIALGERFNEDQEVTVRIVSPQESQQLNNAYRGKEKPTNVLSFPFEALPGIQLHLLGDLVVCAEIVAKEANEQQKPLANHWAHMLIHGTLHLLGFDHENDQDAQEMEQLEVSLLSKLSIDDPYQDH
ncbi:rRNA maturation RNase YbeY [Aliiglaciecola sp. LCG003]|uniref:rRNA maturation RNase YbeY n=1 Tax=Aliiglaciecola sp. LCG003 TaxID=3053655 RepID=UPI002573FF3F|nr:rRNA maturation RNase YbeY [Aliiglaciecola sp. LCG003]WJG08022.1 rRNA maturation RNase YbeY [Aliiglaciecola sp. LCG003]